MFTGTKESWLEKTQKARDVMAWAPTIEVDKSITDAALLLVNSAVSMDTPLTKVMTADVITTDPDATIIDCIRMLENHEISAMPIVEKNKVVGIISGDILARQTLFRLLQTMV